MKHRQTVILWAAIALLYGVLFSLGISCPIKYTLGVSCPGCGMTRACFHALCLDFKAAFYFHPLWVLLPPFGLAFLLLRHRQGQMPFRIIVAFAAALMLAVWLWRMLTGVSGSVVVFEPQNGLIGRCVRAVFGVIPKWFGLI